MTTETYVHHCHILAVTDREPPFPPLVYLTDMAGHTERLALADVQHRLRQVRAEVEILEAAERMLSPEPGQETGNAPGVASESPGTG